MYLQLIHVPENNRLQICYKVPEVILCLQAYVIEELSEIKMTKLYMYVNI